MFNLWRKGPTIPWGKHRGKPLKEVPINYLFWLSWRKNLDKNHPELCKAVKKILKKHVVKNWEKGSYVGK